MTEKRRTRILTAVMICVLCTVALSGCGNREENGAAEGQTAEETAAENEASSAVMTASAESAASPKDGKAEDPGEGSLTVTIKAAADGTPTEVTAKDDRDEEEETVSLEQLPFAVHISYYLDGKEMTAEEIAGKSGHVRIRFDYENRTEKTVKNETGSIKTKVPFLFLSAVILSEEHFSNVQAEDGGVSSFKNSTVAYGYALPDLKELLALSPLEEKLDSLSEDEDTEDTEAAEDTEESENTEETEDTVDAEDAEEKKVPDHVEIEADTTDFRLDFTATIVTNGLLKEADLSGLADIEDLIDDMEEFADGGNELADAAEELNDGTGEFYDYLVEYVNGAEAIVSGAAQLSYALEQLDANSGALNDGAAALQEGLEKLNESLAQAEIPETEGLSEEEVSALSEAVMKLSEDGTAIASSIPAMTDFVARAAAAGVDPGEFDPQAFAGALTDMQTQMGVLTPYLEQMASAAQDAGLGDLAGQLGTLKSGVSQLASGAGQLTEGLKTYTDAVTQLKNGAWAMEEGAGEYASAGTELRDGFKELLDGVGEFRDGVKELNEDGIQKLAGAAGPELQDVLDAIRALQCADRDYRFVRASGEAEENVRFLVETEEVKAAS